MEIQRYEKMPASVRTDWLRLMEAGGLTPDEDAEYTVMIYEDEKPAASAARCGNILKYFAVAEEMQGMNLTSTLVTELRKNAFEAGIDHLFLYTKPKNKLMFEGLHFYQVAKTADVLLMENQRDGIERFLSSLPAEGQGEDIGAVVMNCNPFTLGHRYLIETAASMCSHLYVFVLSEDKSLFSAQDRMVLVKKGISDLKNISVLPTGDYLISSATFPDYFLKKKTSASAVQCALDCKVFAEHFAPRFGIKKRFAGSEPGSELTESYNRTMEELLPRAGISFTEIPRKATEDGTVISASLVRSLLGKGRGEELRKLVPETTFEYLEAHGMI